MATLKKITLFLIFSFLIIFPKGGIKIADIPITWGYILLFACTPFGLYSLMKFNKQYIYILDKRKSAMILCLPFVIYSIIILCLSKIGSLGFLFSFLISLNIVPYLFLFVYNEILDKESFRASFERFLVIGIRIVTVFGLLLFLQNILTGKMLEIPYLTVNLDDFGKIDQKHNLRGELMKFTSTYNNGNLYGICMLIIMPLYLQLEKNKVFKTTLIVSLLLTLSRTVWIGLVIYTFFLILKNIKSAKGWIILICTTLSLVIFTPILLNLMGVGVEFLFDKNLGGRSEQLEIFDHLTLFGSGEFLNISEIVYVSILQQFGLVGILLFMIYILSPIIVNRFYGIKTTPIEWGLIIYLVICMSDGAILLIPTMVFYWFIASYSLKPTIQTNQ